MEFFYMSLKVDKPKKVETKDKKESPQVAAK